MIIVVLLNKSNWRRWKFQLLRGWWLIVFIFCFHFTGGPKALNLIKKHEIDGVDQWPSLTHLLPSPRPEILLNIDDVEGVEGIRRGNFKLVRGSYYNGNFDKWYNREGKPIKDRHPPGFTPMQKKLYSKVSLVS